MTSENENKSAISQDISQVDPDSSKPVRYHGFADPKVNAKARERSLATRRKRQQKIMDVLPGRTQNLESTELTGQEVEPMADLVSGFTPTIIQMQVLAVALSMEHGDSMRHWFKVIGHNRNTWYHWIKNPLFVEWWNKAWEKGLTQYRSEWIAIGLKNMAIDKDYWKEMGSRIFDFIPKIAVKEEKTEDEEKLTKELLDLYTDINKERKMKTVDGEVVEVTPLTDEEQVDKELTELNKHVSDEGDKNASSNA